MGKSIRENTTPEIIQLTDLVGQPVEQHEMLIPDLWPEKMPALLTADGGTGKTHFALQLVKCIASGEEIAGTPFRCPSPRPVVYFSQEDGGKFLGQEMFCQYPELRKDKAVTDRIRFVSTALEGNQLFLTDKESRHLMESQLSAGSVFVLDSWSTFLTSDENDNVGLTKNEIRFLREIIRKSEATPLIIHHRPKRNSGTMHQGSSRGATAIPNACRLHLMMEGSNNNVKLSFEKVSRGRILDPMQLIFDEDQRLFVLGASDRCLGVFSVGQELTTSEVIVAMNKDPKNDADRDKILDMLRRRSKRNTPLKKVKEGVKGEDAVWRRVA